MHLKKYDKVLLFFFVAAIISSYLIWVFEERFTPEEWRESVGIRYKMADDLIDSKFLIGKTKEEVITVLEEPEIVTPSNSNHIIYKMGRSQSFNDYVSERLVVVFDNDVVVKVIRIKD
ncbi:outer membrane protein assembly factor BamE [Psychroserpens sp. AS72]